MKRQIQVSTSIGVAFAQARDVLLDDSAPGCTEAEAERRRQPVGRRLQRDPVVKPEWKRSEIYIG